METQPLCGRYEYLINSYLTDSKQQLSLPAMFYLLQESAIVHAESHNFGWSALSENNSFWALARIKAQIDDYPLWKDSIFVETWSKGPDSVMAYRDFEIFSSNNRKILSATSAWLMLNRDTRKPQRIALLKDKFPARYDRNALDLRLEKLPQHNIQADDCDIHTVPYSAIDMNGHVNNTLYIQWIIDSFPVGYILNHDVYDIEINYLQEAMASQKYCVIREEFAPDEYLCSIVRRPDNKELSRMMLKFRRKS
jgi:medium-chain acyl-[acyl-carrier-protein] hydrolase